MAVSRSNGSARNKRGLALGLALALLTLLLPGLALAKKRVVVLGFDGPQSGKAEAAVITAVKKKHTVVSAAQYSKAAKKLKARKPTAKNVAKIANEIQVDAIVSGKVARKGAKWSLVVIVKEGVTGKAKGTVKIPLRGPRIDARAKQDISDNVLPLVGKTRPISGEEVEDEGDEVAEAEDEDKVVVEEAPDDEDAVEDEPPAKGKKGKQVAKVDEKVGKGKKKPPVDEEETPTGDEPVDETGEDDEAVPGVDDGGDDGERQVASADDAGDEPDSAVAKRAGGGFAGQVDAGPGGGPRARRPALVVNAGVSAVGRTLSFTVSPTLQMNQLPNGYEGAIVPGGLVEGELYPLAFGDPGSFLAGIGLTFGFDRVFVLKSKFGPDEFDTTQQRFGAGLKVRIPIGSRPTLPTISLAAGYNQLTFDIDSGQTAIGLPDAKYTYVDPGLAIRYPVGTPSLAIILDARYLLVLDAGDMVLAENYGTATVNGIDVDAGLEYRIAGRFPLRAGFRYKRIAYDFDGNGAQSNNRDGDMTTQDVGGALDVFTGGYVTAGFVF